MKEEPLVSVIIPVYNGADYLKEAIDSVLLQTYSNIELIVVNDGSTDGGETEKIAMSYGEKIRYFRKENGGVASALNKGIQEMSGEYFAWLSHDDIFYTEKIRRQVELLLCTNAKITACAYQIMNEYGIKRDVIGLESYEDELLHINLFPLLNGMVSFCGVILHKSIFEKYGTFREDLRTTQDYEFLFRVLRNEKCVYSKEVLYAIRYHSMQGSRTISCFDEERDTLWSTFISQLETNEKELLYKNVYNFYYQILIKFCIEKWAKKTISCCLDGLQKYRTQGTNLLPRKDNIIWIYGAGIRGRKLCFDLRCRGYDVAGFLDADIKKAGTYIDGVVCEHIERASKLQGTILIASVYEKEMERELLKRNVKNYMFQESFQKNHIHIAPTWEAIEKVMQIYEEDNT